MLVSLVEDRSKASGWAGLSSLDLCVAAGHELSSVLLCCKGASGGIDVGMARAGQEHSSAHAVTECVSVLLKEQSSDCLLAYLGSMPMMMICTRGALHCR